MNVLNKNYNLDIITSINKSISFKLFILKRTSIKCILSQEFYDPATRLLSTSLIFITYPHLYLFIRLSCKLLRLNYFYTSKINIDQIR